MYGTVGTTIAGPVKIKKTHHSYFLQKQNKLNFTHRSPFAKRSMLSKRPSTFERSESKSNGAAKP